MAMRMPEPARTPMSARSFRRTDSIPQSAGIAHPPALPPSPPRTATLPSYPWDAPPPTAPSDYKTGTGAMTTSPVDIQHPPSPGQSYTETFVNEAAFHGHGEEGIPSGPTYIFWVIPSRIGVAGFASLMFVCSIGMAVAASLIANRLDGNLTAVQRLAIIFQILNYIFVSIASLVGLYSVVTYLHRNALHPLTRAHSSAQLFCGLLLGHLPFSVASGALSIHIVFKATNQALRAGIQTAERQALAAEGQSVARELMELFVRSSSPSAGIQQEGLACWALEGTPLYWMCKKTQLIKALIVILYLVLWFLEVVALYAGTRYSTQLHSVEMIKNVEDEENAEY